MVEVDIYIIEAVFVIIIITVIIMIIVTCTGLCEWKNNCEWYSRLRLMPRWPSVEVQSSGASDRRRSPFVHLCIRAAIARCSTKQVSAAVAIQSSRQSARHRQSAISSFTTYYDEKKRTRESLRQLERKTRRCGSRNHLSVCLLVSVRKSQLSLFAMPFDRAASLGHR